MSEINLFIPKNCKIVEITSAIEIDELNATPDLENSFTCCELIRKFFFRASCRIKRNLPHSSPTSSYVRVSRNEQNQMETESVKICQCNNDDNTFRQKKKKKKKKRKKETNQISRSTRENIY